MWSLDELKDMKCKILMEHIEGDPNFQPERLNPKDINNQVDAFYHAQKMIDEDIRQKIDNICESPIPENK
jgi:hypothetical protein